MRMIAAVVASLSLVSCASAEASRETAAPVAPHPLIGQTIGLDHVLLWSKDRAAGESFLRDSLGFQLGPAGAYAHGIRHNIIRFQNRTFIEYLWLSDPEAARQKAPWAYEFVARHDGSNAFGVQVASIDATHAALARAGLRPEQPMAEELDPDGPEGPRPPVVNEWRFMFLGEGAAPGDPFFVQYKPKESLTPAPQHPNGALQLSSVWIAVTDLAKAQQTYADAGFVAVRKVHKPALAANGVALAAGQGEVWLISPTGPGALRDRLAVRGDHVVGMGIKVRDLAAARAFLRARLANAPQWEDRNKRVLLVPAVDELGVYFAFHE